MGAEQQLGIHSGLPPIIERLQAELKLDFELPHWARQLKEMVYLPEKVTIADPLSYCAGVVRSDDGIEDMFREYPNGFYLYHAPIHSDTKLAEWERRGATLIKDLEELKNVPVEPVVYLSAHGVGPDVWLVLMDKRAKGKDAKCPLVDKTHREVISLIERGFNVWLFGNRSHDEIEGTVKIAPDKIFVVRPNVSKKEIREQLKYFEGERLGVRSQTTLNFEDIKDKIAYIKSLRPDVDLPKKEDICFASQNRQEAIVRAITVAGAELIIIFGSDESKRQPSSNTIRLREVSEESGAQLACIVEDISEIKAEWFNGITNVGVSAGASAPPAKVGEFLICLKQIGLKSSQLQRITVAEEPQVFAQVRDFDFSKAA